MPPADLSSPRGAKHGRAASSVTRDAKRHRDDETVLSDMSIDPWAVPSDLQQQPSKSHTGRTRKRAKAADETDEETTERGDAPTETGGSDAEGTDAEEGDDDDDDEAWLVRQQTAASKASKGKGKEKVARTSKIDSPSKRKRRVQKGKRDPFITSPPGTKALGKRVHDDADDHDIGDEWTDLNGLRWRMGEDRELRREAVVQELRPKYPDMPKDSRHPDAKLLVPVLVEKFLTETEYEEMRAAKKLGFQEEERQRDIEAAEKKRREQQEREEDERRKRVAAQGGRAIATPEKLRNLDALYGGASPVRRHAPSSLRGVLPVTLARSRSFSGSTSAKTSSPAPSTRSSPSTQHKRLSLSMGSETKDASSASTPTRSQPMSAPTSTVKTPQRSLPSLRVPLSSPSSAAAGVGMSPLRRVLGSLGEIMARRKPATRYNYGTTTVGHSS